MHIEAVKIDIGTYQGHKWGRYVSFMDDKDVPFDMNLIFAENEVGKSSFLKSIAYCLKGEDVYSGQPNVTSSALTDVLTDRIEDEKISSSLIYLQLTHKGKRIVIRRNALDNTTPIEVFRDLTIKDINDKTPAEYFKNKKDKNIDGNETINEFLMGFYDFPIHKAVQNNGAEGQIYFQNILPLFYIPQIAWNDIQGSNPSYQVSSYKKIAFQILTNLSDVNLITDKLKLQEHRNELSESLKSKEILDEIVGVADFNSTNEIKNQIQVLNYDLDVFRTQIKNLETEMGIREETYDPIRKEYSELSREIERLELDKGILKKEIDQFNYYLNKIQEDIKKVDKLKTAKLLISSIPVQQCPHCYNEKKIDTSLELTTGNCSLCGETIRTQPISNEEELLDYLKDEKKDFSKQVNSKQNKLKAVDLELFQKELRAKEIKKTIDEIDLDLKPKYLESYFKISNKIGSTENRLTNLDKELRLLSNYENLVLRINFLETEIKKINKKIRDIQKTGMDTMKIRRFNATFKKYLQEIDFLKYEKIRLEKANKEENNEEIQQVFESFFNRLNINEDDYKPEISGKNIYNITSASGLIRIINAYYLALLEMCLHFSSETLHPGILIIDEPRQQNLDLEAYKKITTICQTLCTTYAGKVQIILASGNFGTLKKSDIRLELSQTDYLIKRV